MNRQKNNIKKSLPAFILFAWMLIFIPALSHAQSVNDADSSGTSMGVRYLGNETDIMLIEVYNANPSAQKFNLTIYNSDGDVLYKLNTSSVDFQQKYKIPKSEDNGQVNVVITEGGTKKNFEILSTTRFSQDVVVRKMK